MKLRFILGLLSYLIVSQAQAAVTFDAQGTASCTADAVTSINCSTLTVGSGSNRAMVTMLIFSATVTGITVSWDNTGTPQSMTSLGTRAGTGVFVALFGLTNPNSGAKQLHVAWTGSADVYVDSVAYTGVNQTGGATSFPNFIGNNTSSNSATVTVTSAVGDAVVACGGSAAGNATSQNNTSVFTSTVANNINGWGNRAAGAATVAMTATLNTSTTWTQTGVDVAAAPSGSTAHALISIGVGK